MKKIDTQGITYIETLEGSKDWYWGTDYTSGDLYEAEELFKQGHPINQNRLLFIHYPDGKTVQPVVAGKGQYFGRPIYYDNRIYILMVDFPNGKIKILQFNDATEQTLALVEIPLATVEDCYNLLLKTSPLMLTRQSSDNKFQILWPEKVEFNIENTESFYFRIGEKLYFSAWYEDPDYREEIMVRNMDTSKIVDRVSGSITVMPDGQMWILG
ncbi:hypothetical protein [Oscillibacter ruminantium]|uniref:hypothetical protein n=1 Tax=Oscillibacter ruminantium TaxID=1263547 RepID=UPI00058ECFD3|nr:hypothetical protein [Oscillibacter ruminantium]